MTSYGKFIDLIAMNADGVLSVIELKRDRTAREVVTQLLEYASWAKGLSHDDIKGMYVKHSGGVAFERGFEDRFGSSPPERINETHRLIVVAAELDPSTERIIDYLSDYGVPVNAVFFRYSSVRVGFRNSTIAS